MPVGSMSRPGTTSCGIVPASDHSFASSSRFIARVLRPAVTALYHQTMKAIIFHNPNCGTSRKTLEILRDSGAEVTVREYLKDPPSRDELQATVRSEPASARAMGFAPRSRWRPSLALPRPMTRRILDAMVAASDPHQPAPGRDRQGRPPVPPAGCGSRTSSSQFRGGLRLACACRRRIMRP